MNKDVEDRLLQDGDYRHAVNIRNGVSENESVGAVENVRGNKLLVTGLPTSMTQDHVVIGTKDDKINNSIYYFLSDESGPNSPNIKIDSIVEYDKDTGDVNIIMADQPTGGSSSFVLNFSKAKPVLDIDVKTKQDGDRLLYWNDRKNPPRKTNIDRWLRGDYPVSKTALTEGSEQYIDAIQYAPHTPPVAEYKNDASVTTNNLRNKLFQFTYRYVYPDNETTAWSPISKIPLPTNEVEFRPNDYYPTSLDNAIDITFDVEDPYVERVQVAARDGNFGNFFLVDDVDTPALGNSVVRFYNDETYTAIDNTANGRRLFDWLPKRANSQAMTDEGRVMYGGILENFDPVQINAGIEPIYQPFPDTTLPKTFITGFSEASAVNNPFDFSENPRSQRKKADRSERFFYLQGQGGLRASFGKLKIEFVSFTAGDTARIILNNSLKHEFAGEIQEPELTEELSYTVKETDSPSDIAQAFADKIKNLGNKTEPTPQSPIPSSLTDLDGNDYVFATQYWGQYTSQLRPIYNTQPYQGVSRSSVKVNSSGELEFVVQTKADRRVFPLGDIVYIDNDFSVEVKLDNKDVFKKSFKAGARHDFGVIYYDKANRSGLVNTIPDIKNIYVKHLHERGQNEFNGYTEMKFQINSNAPDWATHWQLAYTGNLTCSHLYGSVSNDGTVAERGYNGFVYGITQDVDTSDPRKAKISLDSLEEFNSNTPEPSTIAYTFSEGDRIRFIDGGVNFNTGFRDWLEEDIDTEILSYDEDTNEITVKNVEIRSLNGNKIINGMTFEIYTPRQTVEEKFYYEIGEAHPVGPNGEHFISDRAKRDDSRNLDQGPNTPGTLFTSSGDTYMKLRGTPYDRWVEDYNFSDYYQSDFWDRGRANIVDKDIKEIFRPDVIYFSGRYIDDTNINRLSEFYPDSFRQYNDNYGSIQKLHTQDKRLHVFQELKVGQVGISEDVLYDNTGGVIGQVKRQDQVLSDIRYYAGEYGIGKHPESFSEFGGRLYFADPIRGMVLRLSRDGMTPISDYGMHGYFKKLFREIRNQEDDNNKIFVWGVYDSLHEEMLLSVKHYGVGFIEGTNVFTGVTSFDPLGKDSEEVYDKLPNKGMTVAFSEPKNKWTTFYSFRPEIMGDDGDGIITYDGAEPYLHFEDEATRGEFYGAKYPAELTFVSNASPDSVKLWESISVHATDKLSIPEITNQKGQKSNLIEDDMRNVEGVFKSSFLRDENTPNLNLPLIEGDVLRSEELTVKIRNESDDRWRLFSASVELQPSELTNR